MVRGKIRRANRLSGHDIDASNSIPKRLHASSTHGLKLVSTIRLDQCVAEGQTRANDDFGHGHTQLILGRKSTNHEQVYTPIGTFHLLLQELQLTAIIASSENAKHNMH